MIKVPGVAVAVAKDVDRAAAKRIARVVERSLANDKREEVAESVEEIHLRENAIPW